MAFADVDFVDSAGKVLLVETYRDGVDILACNGLAAALRDEITGGSTSLQPPTTRRRPRRRPSPTPRRR
jgi:hypothetical protein